jgi:putative PIN family toxin of toxin-antitoxin system
MIRAVLDANVFVNGALTPRGTPAKILAAWRSEQFQLLISPAILEEMDRVLHYPKIVARYRWPKEKIRLFIDDLSHLAILTPGDRTLKVIVEDPSDNRYLECAVEGIAEYVVTGDQYLLRLGKYQKIRILTPKDFLGVLSLRRDR